MKKCTKCGMSFNANFQTDTCPSCDYEIQTKREAEEGEKQAPLQDVSNVTPIANGTGLRYNKGKLPIKLVPPSSILAMAEVFAAGAEKYAERNWEKGFSWSVPYECAMRHLLVWWAGEDLDKESGKHHLKHALTNIAMLVEFLDTYPSGDDRPRRKND